MATWRARVEVVEGAAARTTVDMEGVITDTATEADMRIIPDSITGTGTVTLTGTVSITITSIT